jgi:Ca-activated chloride channel family protein
MLGLIVVTFACSLGNDDGPPRNAAQVEVIANTSLTIWLQAAIENFHQAEVKTTAGKPVFINLIPLEAGQATADIAAGVQQPGLWIPDSGVWADVVAEQGQPVFQQNCLSIAQSPLVIAMWRPIAEALGWPGRSLGWLDISSLAADPSAWNYYSGGQFGPTLRLGHTHPGLSGSGTSALLAIVQAAESKAEAVTAEDIRQPIVQASVTAFEAAVSGFSTSTADLGRTMRERGPGYLGAAVVYESAIISHSGEVDIIPIYPFEGTFMATHPACLNSSAGAETQEAALLFRDYLLGPEAQQLAVAHGLRPVNDQVAIGPPLDAARGIDLSQPEIIFSSPSVETIYAAQDLWQAARKDMNLVMLLDISGSMAGDKIGNMRRAAIQFVEQMGGDDFLTIIPFSDQPAVFMQHAQVGPNRGEAINIIAGLQADGGTALYDAIGFGGNIIAISTSGQTSNALVVLSDGQDTSSVNYTFSQQLIEIAGANNTAVFTIAYGDDANNDILAELAQKSNGNFYLGNEANIGQIYQEMSAVFGGSVGIGR